ncbi:hypothetical protein CJ030_MR4G007293 [Morella rubra]|uniref:Uncharacterized protein n=1 Tax=Morella rubra TaxID=262757 RepID=A0A6A1VSI4_9ROSI|nr:hypothetical protein CJ030_MR4G007293 [Morella rubra]
MMQEDELEQQRVEMLSRSVIVESEVYVVDFEELKYMGWSINDIMDNQDWIGYLKREDIASVDLVREFYAALLDVEDIEAMLWTVTVRGVTFQLSPNILGAAEPFLTTTPGTLRVMSRRLGAIEDQLRKMSESTGEGSSQLGSKCYADGIVFCERTRVSVAPRSPYCSDTAPDTHQTGGYYEGVVGASSRNHWRKSQ